MMKLPCEIIVSQLLPTARGALAKELVKVHGYTQIEVAGKFGVTSAAVSQYINGLRGGNPLIDGSSYREQFYREISDSADRISAGEDITVELCCLCVFFKESGMLQEIYSKKGSEKPISQCMECPRKNMVPPRSIPRA
ncbi:MAG: transcriptional regulator [Candidatus Methanomethylophilaceae archaeon]|jgi:predicted transcriptional regulator|nr:transcriptional regulator [Candidatus Methanomethylophilaceae archaeon]NLF33954.1 transcriptional regulator [Thermoplasmatales archaeon]